MKKVFLSLAFVLATSSLLNANSNEKSLVIPNNDPTEYCYNEAAEIAGILAIWNNNSMQEEEDDFMYFLGLCLGL